LLTLPKTCHLRRQRKIVENKIKIVSLPIGGDWRLLGCNTKKGLNAQTFYLRRLNVIFLSMCVGARVSKANLVMCA
jgi:hypothetical protein